MKDGFYYLKTKDGSEEPVLVHGYHFDGQFVFGFNIHDGGGLLPIDDLTENTVIVPVSVVESQPAERQGDGQSLRTTDNNTPAEEPPSPQGEINCEHCVHVNKLNHMQFCTQCNDFSNFQPVRN